jgi:hypothetical protein
MIDDEIMKRNFSKNLIGIITDGAAVFKGKIKGVHTRMSQKIPGLITQHCLAHCTDLVGKKAFLSLTIDIESFLMNVVNYFRRSPLNKMKFLEFQEVLNIEPSNILGISKTRWLELYNGIKRILDKWDSLTLYFKGKKY